MQQLGEILAGRGLSDMQRQRRRLAALAIAAGGRATAQILFSGTTVADNATVGTAVGTASITGSVTGTASYSLTNSAGGKYSINSSTGAVTVAGALTAGTDTITIAVSGLTPSVPSASFNITVTSSSNTAGQPVGLLLILTKAS